jgi:hypothetical protein
MFPRVRLCVGGVMTAAVLAVATAAGAVTVNLDYDRFNRSKLIRAQAERADFRAGLAGVKHVEGFERFRPWGVGTGTQNLRHTAVGSFTPFGKTGSGNSVVGDGGKLQVRNDNHMRWGRYNPDGSRGLQPGNWLDSNDNRGIKWRISGLGEFDALGFFVGDVADVGGKFSIKVGDTLYRNLADGARLKNGNIYFVRILLSEVVDKLTIKLMHDIPNDGFSVDGLVVGKVAPIPLPPALLLMLPAFGLLAGVRLLGRPRQA